MALTVHSAHHDHAVATCSRSGTGRSPPRDESRTRRNPGCNLDCPHHEHRRKSAHGSCLLSRLLRDRKRSVSGPDLFSGGIIDRQPAGQSDGLVQTDMALGRHDQLRGDHGGGYRRHGERLFVHGERPCADHVRGEPDRRREFRECEPGHLRGSDLHGAKHDRGDCLRRGIGPCALQHLLRESVQSGGTQCDPDGDGALQADYDGDRNGECQHHGG